jgi:hypothetical protein
VTSTGLSSKSSSNSTAVSLEDYEATIQLSGLDSDSPYSFFCTFKGYDSQLSPNVATASLTTLPKYPPARGKIYFTRVTSIAEARKGLALAFAILEIYITPLLIDDNILRRNRHLQGVNEFEFVVTAPVDVETVSPLDMILSLDSNRAAISTFLPSLDTSANISPTASIYNSSLPEFIYSPRLLHVTNTSLTVESILSTNGRIYGILVSATSPTPTSWQIIHGLNAYNQRVPAGLYQSVPCLAQSIATLKFEHVKRFNQYHLWLSAVDDLSGAPQMMKEADLRRMEVVGGWMGSGHRQEAVFFTWEDAAEWSIVAWLWLLA